MKIIFFSVALALIFTACKPKEIHDLQQTGSTLVTVLAEETAQLAGGKKQIVLITAESAGPSNAAEEFKAELKKRGLTVVDTRSVKLGDPMMFDQFGLKATDFFDVIEKHPDAGAIVSLVGPPLLKPEAVRIPFEHPPVLVAATAMIGSSPGIPTKSENVMRLVNAKIIQLAIVDGPDSTAPKATKGDAVRELFFQHHRILRATNP